MRAGGGQRKGAAFERTIGTTLSLWLSRNQRKDLFTRNVLSGGRYTLAIQRQENHGVPGDLMAAHPQALAFAELFFIECKHHASLKLDAFLYAPEKSFLGRVIRECLRQAQHAKRRFWLIAKQNARPPVVFVHADIGGKIVECAAGIVPIAYFDFESTYCFLLSDIIMVNPQELIRRMAA